MLTVASCFRKTSRLYSFYTVKRSILELSTAPALSLCWLLDARHFFFFLGGPFLPFEKMLGPRIHHRKKSIWAVWSCSIKIAHQCSVPNWDFWRETCEASAVRQAAWDGKWGHEAKLWPARGLAISSPQRCETNQNRRTVLGSCSNSFKVQLLPSQSLNLIAKTYRLAQ